MQDNMIYDANERALIFFSTFKDIAFKKWDKLIKIYSEPRFLLENFKKDEKSIKNSLSESEYNAIINKYSQRYIQRLIEYLEEKSIKVVTLFSKMYPKKLYCLDIDKPICLYFKGDITLVSNPTVAIVGSRKHTLYGETITKQFSGELTQLGFTIVSGLAYGIDAFAHRECLNNDGKTIAVIAGGFDNIYPQSNINLANEIMEKGLILSESYPSVKVQPYMFPIRNRIISALSDGVLITEARLKSGALITAERAAEQGKYVFAVCGNINSPSSQGSNSLIKNGAHIAFDASDILNIMGINSLEKVILEKLQNNYVTQDEVETQIMELLEYKDCSFNEILEEMHLKISDLNDKLFMMELDGRVIKLSGNSWGVNRK